MKVKGILVAVLIVSLSATSALAWCPGPPPPPPPHCRGGGYSGGSMVAAGLGGLILGALLASNSNRSCSPAPRCSSNNYNNSYNYYRAEEAVNAYKEQSRQTARAQLDFLLETLKTASVHDAMSYICSYWKSQNKNAILSENGYESKILVTNFDGDYAMTYSVDAARGLASLTIGNSKLGVSETVHGNFTPRGALTQGTAQGTASNLLIPVPPQMQTAVSQPIAQPMAQPPAPNGQGFTQVSQTQMPPAQMSQAPVRTANSYPYVQMRDKKQLAALGTKLLGFTVSQQNRTSDGYMRVSNVKPATAAAYVGLESGAVLYKVDNYSTADVAADTLHTYIINRARQDKTVSITFSVHGKHKTKTARIKP